MGRRGGAPPDRRRRLGPRGRRPRARRLPARGGPGTGRGAARRRSSARTRRTRAHLRVGRHHEVSEGRHQRPRRLGRGDGQPGRVRHQGGAPVSPDRAGQRHGRAAAAAAPAGRRAGGDRRLGERPVRRDGRRTRGRRRRVLRRARARRDDAGADADPAPVLCRSRLEQADLPVQRAPLARRRSGRAAAARGSQARTQQQLAAPRLLRRARHAGPVGVPVVRSVGSRVPHGPVGASRSGVREVPAPGAAARVVPASERRAARVRVELRRRQPAGARDGGTSRLPDRRRPRPRVPRAHLPEAAGQLHLVGEPRGRGRQQRLQRRLPRSRQHQPDRSLQPPGRRRARAGRRDGVDGLLRARDARDRNRARGARTTSTWTW